MTNKIVQKTFFEIPKTVSKDQPQTKDINSQIRNYFEPKQDSYKIDTGLDDKNKTTAELINDKNNQQKQLEQVRNEIIDKASKIEVLNKKIINLNDTEKHIQYLKSNLYKACNELKTIVKNENTNIKAEINKLVDKIISNVESQNDKENKGVKLNFIKFIENNSSLKNVDDIQTIMEDISARLDQYSSEKVKLDSNINKEIIMKELSIAVKEIKDHDIKFLKLKQGMQDIDKSINNKIEQELSLSSEKKVTNKQVYKSGFSNLINANNILNLIEISYDNDTFFNNIKGKNFGIKKDVVQKNISLILEQISETISNNNITNEDIDKINQFIKKITNSTEEIDSDTKSTLNNINIKLEQYKKNNNSKVNGELDYVSTQLGGTCWFHAGVESIASTDWGKKLIKHSVKQLSSGIIQVKIPSDNIIYYITPEEIINAKDNKNIKERISQGDDDMVALGVALRKNMLQHGIKDFEGKLAGTLYRKMQDGSLNIEEESLSPVSINDYKYHYEYFTDKEKEEYHNNIFSTFNSIYDKFSTGKTAIEIGFQPIDGSSGHAYSIVGIDKNNKEIILKESNQSKVLANELSNKYIKKQDENGKTYYLIYVNQNNFKKLATYNDEIKVAYATYMQ